MRKDDRVCTCEEGSLGEPTQENSGNRKETEPVLRWQQLNRTESIQDLELRDNPKPGNPSVVKVTETLGRGDLEGLHFT